MPDLIERIVINPDVRGGMPCLRKTRVAVADVLNWLAQGAPYEEILRDFPYLERDDILAALAWAARREEGTAYGVGAWSDGQPEAKVAAVA